MRFMMLMLPKDYVHAAADVLPTAEMINTMSRYNDQLAKSGALVALEGLHPSQKGARIAFSGGEPSTIHAPFPGVTEIVGGYWVIDVASCDEAIEWARKCPAEDGDVIEIRQIMELSDFPPEVLRAAQ